METQVQKIGGYGGYSAGIVYLKSSTTLYINVGGKGLGDGTHTARKGGYNGGGDATSDGDGNTRQGSGGGATHIAMQTGLLSSLSNNIDSILIVAGGGGGASANAALAQVYGGAGGGFKGNSGETFMKKSYNWTGTGRNTDNGIFIWPRRECISGAWRSVEDSMEVGSEGCEGWWRLWIYRKSFTYLI